MKHGNAPEARPREILSALWRVAATQALQRTARGSVELSPEKVLLAFLFEFYTSSDEGRAALAGAEVSREVLRGVWANDSASCASLRRSAEEQRPDERANALHPLSQLLARHAESAWAAYRWQNASPLLNTWSNGWEDGFARVAHGVPSRVDRLRGLGNAVVPQVAEHIGRLIMAQAVRRAQQ